MLSAHLSMAVLAMQTTGGADHETLLVIFVGIIAFCFLAIILAGLGAVIALLKVKKDVTGLLNQAKIKSLPVVQATDTLIRELTPKIQTITDNVSEISRVARTQVTDLELTLSDVTAKAKSQADRVNGMVSSTLDTTSQVATTLENGIRVPLREISGVFAGFKAGLDVLVGRSPAPMKSQVTTAAHHLESWRHEVEAGATEAAKVNAPGSTAGVPHLVTKETDAGIGERAKRSLVEAGEEVTSATDADRLRQSTQSASETNVLRPR